MSEKLPANHAIVLTPPGPSAIAVVRLVGAECRSFLERLFSANALAGRAVHGQLRDGERVIDDPVVVLDPLGHFVDLNLHGGPWIVQAVLELAAREGFEVIEPRSPLHRVAVDATDEVEAEVLMYLPLARTELAVRALLAQPAAWTRVNAQTGADELRHMLADRALHWLLNLPRVAIVGAPNVGKSTLANQLFATERSITADLPGTTRDWVGEIANIDGLAVMLIDTPGQRTTADPIESEAIARSRTQVKGADLILVVLDASRTLDPEQSLILQQFPDAIRVINKVDKPLAWKLHADAIGTVATTGQGVDELRRAMLRAFGCESIGLHQPRCWTTRQRGLVEQCLRQQTLTQ